MDVATIIGETHVDWLQRASFSTLYEVLCLVV